MNTLDSQKRILLIEDNAALGARIAQLIKTQVGLECDWLIRLAGERTNGKTLAGFRLENGTAELTEIDLDKVSVALIDGSLGTGHIPGWKIVPDLVRNTKIICVGISSDHGPILLEKGCKVVVNKQLAEFETFLVMQLKQLHLQVA